MPVSSVSDFERFARNINSRVGTAVTKIEAEALTYARQKEEGALREAARWAEQSQTQWKAELRMREERGGRAITEEMERQWYGFRRERESALKKRLEVRLKAIFPELAECFVAWVSRNYASGSFSVPKAYAALVERPRFALSECEKEQLLFVKGNLHIEYSVARIIEELGDEIALQMRFEEGTWQE